MNNMTESGLRTSKASNTDASGWVNHTETLDDARQLVDQGELKLAAGLCLSVLKEAPTDIRALTLLAEIAVYGERWQFAANLFGQALELAPEDLAVQYKYAVFLFKSGNFISLDNVIECNLKDCPKSHPLYPRFKQLLMQCRGRSALYNYTKDVEQFFPDLAAMKLPITKNNFSVPLSIFDTHLKANQETTKDLVMRTELLKTLEGELDSDLEEVIRNQLAKSFQRTGMYLDALNQTLDPDFQREIYSQYQKHFELGGDRWLGFEAAYEQIKNPGAKHWVTELAKDKRATRGTTLLHYFENSEFPINGKRILHCAPEPELEAWFRAKQKAGLLDYATIDLGSNMETEHVFDLTQIGLDSEQFDLIICHRVLEHIFDDSKAISELRRLLVPGGCLNVSIPQTMALEKTANWWVPDPLFMDHFRQYGPDFDTMLESQGFQVEVDLSLRNMSDDSLRRNRVQPLRMANAFKQ
jgi:SAM-dependent methyltransferase